MKPLGHGVDLVEVERFDRMLAEHGEKMLKRLFSVAEQKACEGDARRSSRYAARFAAKEAALKALGTGLANGIQWTDVSTENQPSGAPVLLLSGTAAQVAAGLGVRASLVSLSHTRTHAIASVILMGD